MSEQLQNKLYNYHAQPSIEVWNKIDSVLGEDRDKKLSQKLMNYQTAPPPFAWENILTLLGEVEKPVVSLQKRFARPIKYSSAAAILIAVSLVANMLFNKESVSDSVAVPINKQSITPFAPPVVIEKRADQLP